MRKNIGHLLGCVAICTALLGVQQPIHAQVSNPSTWESFVRSGSNPLVRDTFRMQTFSGSVSDNWEYSLTGEASIEDISGVKEIPNDEKQPDRGHGAYALRMPMGSQASFEHFPLTDYDEVKISVRKGGILLVEGEDMKARTYREGETTYPSLVPTIGESGINPFKTTDIKDNPPGLDLIVPAPAAQTKNGYYYVDSVYAHGMIQAYSLFTGNGDWSDPERWSHLPALRHRDALVNGTVTVSEETACANLYVGQGNLQVSATGTLSADRLTIYSDDNAAEPSALRSSGSVRISESITLEKTFAQKGKWYFISLPFDVYLSGIDPAFQLGDDQSDTQGNYFYLQTYNGGKRANTQSLSGNWEVVQKSSVSASQPLLRKNKGYLIALDAAASTGTIRFTSRAGDTSGNLGKSGSLSIQASSGTQNANANHNGWYLCGNPLPAPLPLNQIEANPDLDGYLYIYDGTAYQAYAIGSDFAVPPFSAFFVKASQDTHLSVKAPTAPNHYTLVKTKSLSGQRPPEPQLRQASTVQVQCPDDPEPTFRLSSGCLRIQDLPANGDLRLYTTTGKTVLSQEVNAGASTIPVSLPRGFYILIVRTKRDTPPYKCVLTL